MDRTVPKIPVKRQISLQGGGGGGCKRGSMMSQRSYWHDVVLWTTKTTLTSDYLLKIKTWEKNNQSLQSGRDKESHPRVHDLQHPRLGKPHHGLLIMDTRMGFPCPFRSVVIDSIKLFQFSSLYKAMLHSFHWNFANISQVKFKFYILVDIFLQELSPISYQSRIQFPLTFLGHGSLAIYQNSKPINFVS